MAQKALNMVQWGYLGLMGVIIVFKIRQRMKQGA
jgi:hypothetical protein